LRAVSSKFKVIIPTFPPEPSILGTKGVQQISPLPPKKIKLKKIIMETKVFLVFLSAILVLLHSSYPTLLKLMETTVYWVRKQYSIYTGIPLVLN
jgi:hypothetical protein